MKVLALDLSTHAGYAVLEGEVGAKPALGDHGVVHLGAVVHSFGQYPWSYRSAAYQQSLPVIELAGRIRPDVVVIEEVNLGKDRYAQKLLDYIHFCVLDGLVAYKTTYLDAGGAGGWRQTLSLTLSKDQRKANAKLSRAKREAAEDGRKLDKKALGIRGKVTWKHLAVAYANQHYGLSLKQKDNDVADAICLGTAYFLGATPCNGL